MPKRRKLAKPGPTAHDLEAEGLPSSSGFDSEFRCPGKLMLTKRVPREDDTSYTIKGTRIHEAMAEGDFSKLNKSEGDTASRIAYGEAQIVQEYNFEGAAVEFEQRVWDVDDDFNHTWSARVDRHDWQEKERRLLVIDDKTGWATPPPIGSNWQVRSEAALLAEQYDAREVVVALIHPHHPDSLWEAKLYTREESDQLLATTRHLVKQIQLPNQRRIYGGIQCQWCTAKAICPEYQAHEKQLDLAVDDWTKDQGFTAINRQSPEERAEIVRRLKERKTNIDFLLEQYVELLERAPDSIEGYRVARRLTREVTNEPKAMELVRAEWGNELLWDCLKFSVTALEDKVAKLTNRKEAKAAINRVLGNIIKFKKSKTFLEEARSI